MASQLFANNATGYLNASINSSATSIVLQSGQGASFPSPSGGNWFLVTLFDGTSTIEVVKCTARSTDTLTVVRAQEGTTAASFAAGALIELRATKGTFEGLVQRDATETLTNKTISGASNTLSNIANASLTNSSVTIGSTSVSLGATAASLDGLTTLDTTNLEVTNIKAKDGTAAASIADSTGVASFSANPVLSGGTANGVLYLNGSKVATSGKIGRAHV